MLWGGSATVPSCWWRTAIALWRTTVSLWRASITLRRTAVAGRMTAITLGRAAVAGRRTAVTLRGTTVTLGRPAVAWLLVRVRVVKGTLAGLGVDEEPPLSSLIPLSVPGRGERWTWLWAVGHFDAGSNHRLRRCEGKSRGWRDEECLWRDSEVDGLKCLFGEAGSRVFQQRAGRDGDELSDGRESTSSPTRGTGDERRDEGAADGALATKVKGSLRCRW